MKPKTLCYSYAIGALTEEQKDTIAAHDVLVSDCNPDELADLRRRNPSLEFWWKATPQHVAPWDPRWETDRVWSPTREWEAIVHEHGLQLKDTRGHIITDPAGKHLVNWTSYASVRMLMWIENWWANTIENRKQHFDGLVIEVMADSFGSMLVPGLDRACPSGDGRTIEGVTKPSSEGGDMEPLSVLMRATNQRYRDTVIGWSTVFPVMMNDHVYASGPHWATSPRNCIKIKQENWLNHIGNTYRDVLELPKPGVFCCYDNPDSPGDLEPDRWALLTVATALLKGCYSMLSYPGERIPWRIPEMDYDLGEPLRRHQSKDRIEMIFTAGRVTIDVDAMTARWD